MKLHNKKTGEIKECYSVAIFENALGDGAGEYRTIAELNEEWEDYKPAEPLIKDPKIRKAVRAWAKAEGEDCYYGKDAKTIYNGSGDNIEFWSEPFENLEKDRHYTITELCGEEE